MIVWLKPCPMCSVPVTFGGGSWMLNEGLLGSSVGTNAPGSFHFKAQRASMAAGSKDLASSVMAGAPGVALGAATSRKKSTAGRPRL